MKKNYKAYQIVWQFICFLLEPVVELLNICKEQNLYLKSF
jgi:hypothetical protein